MSTHEAAPELAPIAIDELTNRCLGRLDFVQRVLGSFAVRFEDDFAELRTEVAAGNASATARLAHRMKGACGDTAAHEMHRQMAEIEELALGGQLEEVANRFSNLELAWTRFLERLESLLAADCSDNWKL